MEARISAAACETATLPRHAAFKGAHLPFCYPYHLHCKTRRSALAWASLVSWWRGSDLPGAGVPSIGLLAAPHQPE
jgi:hypothetical protein